MAFTIAFTAVIIIYVIFVIYRKIMQIRAGKYCECSCDDCTKQCGQKKEKK
ncbi:MAG: FeoB-associated Cys-rich membrane protein [Clostridia bacterium]|nr:FeoB-associated Cys-rich membrane protein [Lachnospiraceae bacterium]NCB99269.1 FeoB-associated Cys-rich membrane protein [Clostridia bacterium]NCD01418.1 FeoB-associated Cys-rich membrane protein [Clostridia bacterium]